MKDGRPRKLGVPHSGVSRIVTKRDWTGGKKPGRENREYSGSEEGKRAKRYGLASITLCCEETIQDPGGVRPLPGCPERVHKGKDGRIFRGSLATDQGMGQRRATRKKYYQPYFLKKSWQYAWLKPLLQNKRKGCMACGREKSTES